MNRKQALTLTALGAAMILNACAKQEVAAPPPPPPPAPLLAAVPVLEELDELVAVLNFFRNDSSSDWVTDPSLLLSR